MALIDREDTLNNLPDDLPYKASVKRVLYQAKTVDAVPVVRCKYCKHRYVNVSGIYCRQHSVEVEPDFYCGDGEEGDTE